MSIVTHEYSVPVAEEEVIIVSNIVSYSVQVLIFRTSLEILSLSATA